MKTKHLSDIIAETKQHSKGFSSSGEFPYRFHKPIKSFASKKKGSKSQSEASLAQGKLIDTTLLSPSDVDIDIQT